MRIFARAAVAALATVGLVTTVAPATSAADEFTWRLNIVGFWGTYRGPGRLSSSSVCNQVYYNGTGTGLVPCNVTFTITTGTNVCDLAAGQAAGTASYVSNIRAELDRSGVVLTGADFSGSGVVEGVVHRSATDIFTIRISFASICSGEQEQSTKQFVGDGHLL